MQTQAFPHLVWSHCGSRRPWCSSWWDSGAAHLYRLWRLFTKDQIRAQDSEKYFQHKYAV